MQSKALDRSVSSAPSKQPDLRTLSIPLVSVVDNVVYYNPCENRVGIYKDCYLSIYGFGHTYIFYKHWRV